MMTTASSNQTSLPSVHFPDVPCGSLTPTDQHSLYVLATWRKGGVQRSGTFGEFIRDACHRRDPSGLNSKMAALTGTRNLRSARCGSTKIRPPAGFDGCSAASRDRAARYYPSCLSIPLRNSPLPHRLPVTTQGPLAPTEMFT